MSRSNEQYELFCEANDIRSDADRFADELWESAVQLGRCQMLLERYEREDLKLGLAVDTIDRTIVCPF